MDSLIADVQEVLARLKLEHRSDLLLPDPESTSNQEQSDKDVKMDSASNSAPAEGPRLEIAGANFSYGAQRFIIQAMCFFGHTANEISPCFGLLEQGSPIISVEQVQAAFEHFQNNDGLLSDQRLWERDDARFLPQVRYDIQTARLKQRALRLKAWQLAEDQKLEQTRKNFDYMSQEMADEQEYYKEQFNKSCGNGPRTQPAKPVYVARDWMNSFAFSTEEQAKE